MVNDYWILPVSGIVSVFGMKYGYRTVQSFKIFTRKRMINDYWMEREFGIEYAYKIAWGYIMVS